MGPNQSRNVNSEYLSNHRNYIRVAVQGVCRIELIRDISWGTVCYRLRTAGFASLGQR